MTAHKISEIGIPINIPRTGRKGSIFIFFILSNSNLYHQNIPD